ncbi:MAG: cyclic nucleotide-binding domain-containing protein [Pseudomonadota bacterium]|nr:cyclic nucleotide-binding domain-containing protein [Pseudomonadota bacterium]
MPTESAPRLVVARRVLAGLVMGFDNLGRSVALATLVFTGGLVAGAPFSIVLFLLSGIIGTGTLLLNRYFVGPTFSNVQNTTVAILLPSVVTVAALDIPEEARVVTVFAILGVTAVTTGLAMVLVATMGWSRYIQLIPFPVSAGYLAATGGLLVVSALRMVCPAATCMSGLSGTISAHDAWLVSLTLATAALFFLATRKWPNFGLVGALFAVMVCFYVAAPLLGFGVAELREIGLLQAISPKGPAMVLRPEMLREVRVDLILQAAPVILAAVIVSLFSAMLNITGVELVLRRDMDTRRELTRQGALNIVTGFLGSTVNFLSSSNTTASQLLGGQGRLTGAVTIIVLALGMVFARQILSFVPPFLTAGLLVFFGVSILNGWWLGTRRQSSLPEWLLAGAIVLASLFVGMPAAVVLGITAASVIFVISYARLPVVRAVSDLTVTRSTVDRGRKQAKYLKKHGHEVAVVVLQGFLFFGSIERLITRIRTLLDTHPDLTTIILDCSRVSRLDASSMAALKKLDILAQSRGALVLLAELNTDTWREVERSGVVGPDSNLSLAATTDLALEGAENALVARMKPHDAEDDALSSLASLLGDDVAAQRLFDQMAREEIAAGTRIVTQGETSGDVYLLESGALSVSIRTPDGHSIRVMKQRPGAIVGEIAAYAGIARTADVIADVDSVVYRLSDDKVRELQATDPRLAAHWHRAMAAGLAEKLDRTNKILGQRAS